MGETCFCRGDQASFLGGATLFIVIARSEATWRSHPLRLPRYARNDKTPRCARNDTLIVFNCFEIGTFVFV